MAYTIGGNTAAFRDGRVSSGSMAHTTSGDTAAHYDGRNIYRILAFTPGYDTAAFNGGRVPSCGLASSRRSITAAISGISLSYHDGLSARHGRLSACRSNSPSNAALSTSRSNKYTRSFCSVVNRFRNALFSVYSALECLSCAASQCTTEAANFLPSLTTLNLGNSLLGRG
jgi:hypothetical protein